MLGVMRIRIEVVGEIPPRKGEAKSMLALGHPDSHRVRKLLEAAHGAMADCELLDGDISLDVTVTAPRRRVTPDATNMLGGIADVLQTRPTGADVEHLGPLAQVGCFLDDAQIREIHYRLVESAEVGYVIVIKLINE
jgi:Holliday junction resolvase RusA-like endonuclease